MSFFKYKICVRGRERLRCPGRGKLWCLCLIILLVFSPAIKTYGNETKDPLPSLHARAAVLMDGETKRVLYGKNPEEILPMASTTKVMTLLVTLENSSVDDIVTVSSYAASMPDVQLGIREGEKYVLRDLMYSMMLESHNDSAVAIAEHVGGSVENFAAMMNDKARELGCESTYFITANGLDAADDVGVHATTARDLAVIMACAVKNESFLEITGTMSYSFSDCDKKRQFTVNNKNALLTMTDEALSGKTGFTGNAGYCYVCAVVSEGRTFIIALLGCGWPPDKRWKWEDTQALIQYGKENYELKEVSFSADRLLPVTVIDGQQTNAALTVDAPSLKVLAREDETPQVTLKVLSRVQAPVKAGQSAGWLQYKIGTDIFASYPVTFADNVEAVNYRYYLEKVMSQALGF
ncbi:D-alanyl-D-alanine carboxypeptidase family protein [Catenibacillus scindens]|uniref:D-alanyl-D-alanine carboxypeptidase family protein n=1 Tax=Catenibacillus scindens TaxID=673271 RepID=UPI0032083946